jgi:uncharacterized protein (TIGR03086 family)
MEPFEALAQGRREFESRLTHVGPDDWDKPTPCPEWTVRDLVVHVISGNRMAAILARGGTRDEGRAAFAAAGQPDDLMAAFADSAEEQRSAFAEPGALERTVEHVIGDIPATQLMSFRIGDLAIHAWDLAQGIGVDDALDPGLVEVVWQGMQPLAPFIGASGFFGQGPSGQVGDERPTQQRLLDLAGRRP